MRTGYYTSRHKEYWEIMKCFPYCFFEAEDCPSNCHTIIRPVTRIRDDWWLGPEVIGFIVMCACQDPRDNPFPLRLLYLVN